MAGSYRCDDQTRIHESKEGIPFIALRITLSFLHWIRKSYERLFKTIWERKMRTFQTTTLMENILKIWKRKLEKTFDFFTAWLMIDKGRFYEKNYLLFWILSKWGGGRALPKIVSPFHKCIFGQLKEYISSKMPMIWTLNCFFYVVLKYRLIYLQKW